MDKYIIYKHITPSGKVYVGITKRKDARKRWKYGHGYKHNPHFFNAILKYGWNNIIHQIVKSGVSLEEASRLEKKLIAYYTLMGICYNIAEGGQDGNARQKTELEKKHLSDHLKEYFKTHEHPFKGKHHSKESIRKMSISQKSRWRDNYNKMYNDVVSKIKIGVYNILNGVYKEFDSEREASHAFNIKETTFRRHVNTGAIINNLVLMPIESISFEEALQKAYKIEILNIHCGGQEKEVILLDLDGNYIGIYTSIKQASLMTKVNASSISKVCRMKQNQSGGYVWKFRENI